MFGWFKKRREGKRLEEGEQVVLQQFKVDLEKSEVDARYRMDPSHAFLLVKGLATLLADAPNFRIIELSNPALKNEGEWICVTIQRDGGKTPAQMIDGLKKEIARQEEELESIKEALHNFYYGGYAEQGNLDELRRRLKI